MERCRSGRTGRSRNALTVVPPVMPGAAQSGISASFGPPERLGVSPNPAPFFRVRCQSGCQFRGPSELLPPRPGHDAIGLARASAGPSPSLHGTLVLPGRRQAPGRSAEHGRDQRSLAIACGRWCGGRKRLLLLPQRVKEPAPLFLAGGVPSLGQPDIAVRSEHGHCRRAPIVRLGQFLRAWRWNAGGRSGGLSSPGPPPAGRAGRAPRCSARETTCDG